MIRDLLKWVAPGVVTVLGGTVAALAMTTPGMLSTLEQGGRVALEAAGSDWARIGLTGRHFHLAGTTSSDTERDLAVAALLGVSGASWVDDTVTIAPLAAPYRINVSVDDGAVSLFGSVPNEELRQQLLALDGLAAVDLQIRSGQPDEALWRAGVDFAMAQASLVEFGSFELSGLTLNAVGRASSEKALGHLQMALRNVPSGVSVGAIDVDPVHIAPYTWRAEFDGDRIAISGHVPEERIADRLRLADVSGIPVATGLSLASGAPAGFAEKTRLLVEQLARLESGEARIVDGVSQLVGVPPSTEVAQAVAQALSGTNSIVELTPPRVADYWVSVSRQPGNVLVFDGFVPDEETMASLAGLPGADTSFLKFGAGAPESYLRGVDFGLDVLGFMSEGRVSLAGDTFSVSGVATSPTDYRTIRSLVSSELPQGLVLGELALQAPKAAIYAFSAEQQAGGGVVLSGMVPSPEVEADLLALAGPAAQSRVTFASGETPNFEASAEQALNFLPWLRRGTVRFDGTGWIVEGEPVSAIDKGSIETEFAVRGLAQSGWTLDLSQPAEAPGFADPYLWSAERLPDGSFLFAGNVPAPALQSWLKVHVGSRVADTSRVSGGAPEGFAGAARIAVDVLLLLEEGRIAFDGASWSLSGAAADPAIRDQALSLASALQLPEDTAVSTPEPSVPEPYAWSGSKSEQGIALSGAVPAESLQRFLAVRAGTDVDDQTKVRADAPEGFASEVLQAMDVLALLDIGEVTFDGTRWSAEGHASSADAETVASVLLGTSAPRWTLSIASLAAEPAVAAASEPAEVETPVQAPVDVEAPAPDYAFLARRDANGVVTLSGQVPAETTARYLASLTGASVDSLTVSDGAPEDFVTALRAGMQTLMQMPRGELELSGGTWRLSGEAASQEARPAIEAGMAALGDNWTIDIGAPSYLVQCQAQLAELSAHNAILFQSGAAIIADGATTELDAFAQVLLLCPDAVVDVEGHTDSDGDDNLNLALSVARAEAVVNALIERGVAPSRLYAIGYGETQPVAENDTSDGKRRNRRIVVSVRDAGDRG
jgi:outer membrane protein OmpA-like peptidoglycan-associated protein